MRRIAYLAGLVAAVSWAQNAPPSVDVETLYIDPAGRGTLTVGNGATLRQGTFRLGFGFGYTFNQLALTTETTEGISILHDRVSAQILGAVGVTDWLELGATVPIIIQQFTGANPPFTIAAAGLGTPQVHVKFGILGENRPVFLSLGVSAGLPLGSQAALSLQGFSVTPRINLGKRFSYWTLSSEIAALVRTETTDLASIGGSYWDRVGSNLFFSLAASTNGQTARGELSVRMVAPLQPGWVGIEGLLGLRIFLKYTELFLALGPGFGGYPNTPGFRAYLGAAFGNANQKPAPKCIEGQPYELADCPGLDRDGDGVPNISDKCVQVPEDRDGFEDSDGCPDADNDADGVADDKDKCPLQAGPAENDGCNDEDLDSDGVPDRIDKCLKEPEDLDGFQDDDGCPEVDNDEDGFKDVIDACPNEKGIAEEKGCPAKDDDKDTVLNHLDNCPQEAGDPANQGCPAKNKQLVVIETGKLKLLEVVQFATGRAAIMPASNKLLTQVATVLKAQTRIKHLQIEGHTDNVGKPESNLKLSQMRADSVKAFLVKKGVEADRLKAVGFGQEKPLESNSTAAGRAVNRRVEMIFMDQ